MNWSHCDVNRSQKRRRDYVAPSKLRSAQLSEQSIITPTFMISSSADRAQQMSIASSAQVYLGATSRALSK
eukprot:scaffold515404_cov18-Prasinocladus_malaysianus.AAC.1